MFDEDPQYADPHKECRGEIHQLTAERDQLRETIERLVYRLEVAEDIRAEVIERQGSDVFDNTCDGYETWNEDAQINIALTVREIRQILGTGKDRPTPAAGAGDETTKQPGV